MRYRMLIWLFASVVVLAAAAPVQTAYQGEPSYQSELWSNSSSGEALAAVTVEGGLGEFEALGIPLFSRLPGLEGEIYITAVDPNDSAEILAAGAKLQLLDSPLSGNYYLAYVVPGREAPVWKEFGRHLLAGTDWHLLRLQPEAAGRLAAVGIEVQTLTLTPKPLSSVSVVPDYTEIIDPDPVIQAMMDQVVTDTVALYDGGLSGEFPVMIGGENYTIMTRYTYSGASIQKATQFVGAHLTDLGMAVEYHQWSGVTYPNVIGEITGETNPEKIFIISAHLDDMPSGPLAPGADDNASGVTAVLIAADIFSQFEWNCTLRFALWTGEEQGLNGSAAYANRAYYAGEDIQGVLNLDMIGWNTPASSPDIDLHANSGVPGSLDLAQLFADVVTTYNLNLNPQIIPNGTGASDHASFWTYNYPAILGIEDYYGGGDFNPYYHTTQDLLIHLDLDYFTDFVKAGVGAFAHMSDCMADTAQGGLDGYVTDADDNMPVAGALVDMIGNSGFEASTATNSSGYYSYTLGVGTYTVTVSAANYISSTVSGITILTDTITTQDFALQPVVIDMYYSYIPIVVQKE